MATTENSVSLAAELREERRLLWNVFAPPHYLHPLSRSVASRMSASGPQ